MQEQKKFRSIKAFRDYDKFKSSEEISPTRILALLKTSDGSLEKGKIAEELETDVESVNRALTPLLQSGIVTIEPGPDHNLINYAVKL
jgi:DNA-binding MarR family transcriptional regulator